MYHRLHFTVIDGKTATTITDTTATSNCILCDEKPTEMNDLEAVMKRPAKKEGLKLGKSPLHARMGSMEYILHLGYNEPFKKSG